jgi:hypothetical protein
MCADKLGSFTYSFGHLIDETLVKENVKADNVVFFSDMIITD